MRQVLLRNVKTCIILGVTTILFLAVTSWMALEMNIWLDEAYTMHTTGSGVFFAIKKAISFEEQPPLYFALLSIWRIVNRSIFFARFFSIIAIFAAVLFLYHVARTYSRKGSVFLYCLFLTNPLVLWAATEMRVYALGICLASMLFWSFHHVFIRKSDKWIHHIVFILASTAGLYTQYFLIEILLVNVVYLMISRNWRSVRRFTGFMVITGILFAPFFVFVTLSQVHSATAYASHQITFINSIRHTFKLFMNQVLPGSDEWSIVFKIAKAFIFLLIAIAFICVRRKIKDQIFIKSGERVLLGLAIGLPMFSVVLYSIGDVSFLKQRYVLFFLPEILYLIFYILVNIRIPSVRVFGSVAFLIFNIASSAITYHHMTKPGDWKHVAGLLQQNNGGNDPIFIYPAWNSLPLSYYITDPARIIPIPRPTNLNFMDLQELHIENKQVIENAVQSVKHEIDKCWFVVVLSTDFCPGIKSNSYLLPEYINQKYTLIDHEHLPYLEIYHVTKRLSP